MDTKVWCLLVAVISAMVEVPCKSRILKVIIQSKRESRAEEKKRTGKEGLGVVCLISFTVSTEWFPYLCSPAVITQRKCKFSSYICFCRARICVCGEKCYHIYSMNAVLTITALATILNLIIQTA